MGLEWIRHHAPERTPVNSILAFTDSEADRSTLQDIAAERGWELSFADHSAADGSLLARDRFAIILCDRDLPGAEWRANIEALHQAAPDSCIMLLSSVNDEYLWNEVIRCGGYDVLTKPLRESQVVPAITLALLYVQQCSATK
jgi:DNA-binding NtrC family response regulator